MVEYEGKLQGLEARVIRVALIPDRFAHYRSHIFKVLGDPRLSTMQVTVLADKNEQRAGIKLADVREFPAHGLYNGTQWRSTIDHKFWKIVWQQGVLGATLHGPFDAFVFWGDAARPSTWLGTLFARLRGKRVIYWTHGLYGDESKLKRFIRLAFYRLSNGFLLYGKWSQVLLNRIEPDMPPSWVIYNSLETNRQLEIVRSLSEYQLTTLKAQLFPDHVKVLVFIGRLNESKQLSLLIKALAILRNTCSQDIRLLLIGDGPEKGALARAAEKLKLTEAVCFYGSAYDDESTIPLLAMSDVLVSPGEVGLTAMHALMAGIPVITHSDMSRQMPEAEAVIDGVNGATFEYGNVEELAFTIKRVLQLLEMGRLTADECRQVIMQRYNPAYQHSIFEAALRNIPVREGQPPVHRYEEDYL